MLQTFPGGSFFNCLHCATGKKLLSWFHFLSNWSILQMSHCSCSTCDCWRWWLAARRQYQSSLGPGNMLKVNLKRGTDVLALTKCLDRPNTDGENKPSREPVDYLVGRVQMEVMREQLWSAENTEHGGVDLSIRSPVLNWVIQFVFV